MLPLLRRLGALALDAVAPVVCPFCDGPACDGCVAATPVHGPAIDGVPVVAAYPYEAAAPAIQRLKYSGRHDLATPLARGLVLLLDEQAARGTLVPVPSDSHRLAERGYNHAALIARALRSPWRDYQSRGLRRLGRAPRQATLASAERRQIDASVFVAAPSLTGRRVILVDDVLTTGATAAACLASLRRGGADPVLIAVVARAGGPPPAPFHSARVSSPT